MLGRSNIVGKPLAQLLLAENATVTIAHSKTKDLPAVCRRADLLCRRDRQAGIRARRLGQAGRDRDRRRHQSRAEPDGKDQLVGDVAYEEAAKVAGAITPVPGGIGPMTIACLLVNTLRAACARAGLRAAGDLDLQRVQAKATLSSTFEPKRSVERATARAAERAIEVHRRLVVGERPHHEAGVSRLRKIALGHARTAAGRSRGPDTRDADTAHRPRRRKAGSSRGCGRNSRSRRSRPRT